MHVDLKGLHLKTSSLESQNSLWNGCTLVLFQIPNWQIKEYLDLYLEITRLHSTLFSQKSALLRCVTNAFKISSFCYIRVCLSLIFLLIWRICFHSGPLPMIFVATTFFHWVNLKQLPMVLTPFLTFQLSSGMHRRTFLVPVFLQTLRPKYRMLPSCRFFLPDILKLKIVNCK